MSYLSDMDDIDMTCRDFVNPLKMLICSSEYSAISISVDDVSNGPNLVKLGKSCGVDGLSTEHFIYAGNYVKYIYLFYLLLLFHMVTYPMVL